MEQVLRKSKGQVFTTNEMVKISILGVLSYLIMFVEFPLPLFPPFLKMDFSDLPAIIGGFALGPVAGITIELIKNLLHFVTKTTTGGIGEIGNFAVGGAFVVMSSYIYKKSHTKKGAVLALFSAILSMTLVGAIMNAVVLLPFYAQFMGGMEGLIAMGQGINSHVNGVWSFAFLIMSPFNVIKGIILSSITLFMYKKVSPLIKR
ncbi:ECF transporter S component [Filifactor villosus]|uniref:Riboflavin transporter n=1 Tax=Filifactor villosus TaxID=29374 RepID=A0ABV9QMM7_9FIRM